MIDISDDVTMFSLKERPEFFETIADRVWREWWKHKGHSAEDVAKGLHDALDEKGCHEAFIASANGDYCGSALIIKSDLDERPEYTPWVAAVWVEPEHRRKGLGAALVAHAAKSAFESGLEQVFLCATPKNSSYYEKLGWTKIEEDIGKMHLTVLVKKAG